MKIAIVSDIHANYDAWSAVPDEYDELWVLAGAGRSGDDDSLCMPRYWMIAEASRCCLFGTQRGR